MEMPEGWTKLMRIDTGDFDSNDRITDAAELLKDMAEAFEFICRPEKMSEQGDPWMYRKTTAEDALKKFKEWK